MNSRASGVKKKFQTTKSSCTEYSEDSTYSIQKEFMFVSYYSGFNFQSGFTYNFNLTTDNDKKLGIQCYDIRRIIQKVYKTNPLLFEMLLPENQYILDQSFLDFRNEVLPLYPYKRLMWHYRRCFAEHLTLFHKPKLYNKLAHNRELKIFGYIFRGLIWCQYLIENQTTNGLICNLEEFIFKVNFLKSWEIELIMSVITKLKNGEKQISLEDPLFSQCYDFSSKKILELNPNLEQCKRVRLCEREILEQHCINMIESKY